jgi:ferrous iron transport protein A
MLINLTEMKTGESGVVREIEGGFWAAKRIQSMGIRVGKKIKKESGRSQKGPQTVVVDNFRLAIGFGMAEKILIEVERNEAG